MSEKEFKGLGRRKSSVAKILMVPNSEGKNKLTINGKAPNHYFPNAIIIQDMEQPLEIFSNTSKKHFTVHAKVSGGGFSGQAGAVRLAITKALIEADKERLGIKSSKELIGEDGKLKPEFIKSDLKKLKLTTRDRRVKERKKFGKYGARRSPQFVKR